MYHVHIRIHVYVAASAFNTEAPVTATYMYMRKSHKRLYSVKEAYNLKEPTNRSHPILISTYMYMSEYPPLLPRSFLVFDPYAPLLFNLYRYLEQNLHFGFVPENQF